MNTHGNSWTRSRIQLPSWAPKFHEVDDYGEGYKQDAEAYLLCDVERHAKGDRHERRGDRQDECEDDKASIER
jgi:hypothetical protein